MFIFELLLETEYNQYVSEHEGDKVATGSWQVTFVDYLN